MRDRPLRIAVLQNDGMTKRDLMPEDIADNLAQAVDLSGAHEVRIEVLRGEIPENRLAHCAAECVVVSVLSRAGSLVTPPAEPR